MKLQACQNSMTPCILSLETNTSIIMVFLNFIFGIYRKTVVYVYIVINRHSSD